MKKMLPAISALAVAAAAVSASADVVNTVVGSGTGATIDGTVESGEYAGTVSGGGSGFGGPVGSATLSLDSDADGIYFALSDLGDYSGNSIRVYLDTTTGGFAELSASAGFNDNADFGREQISRPAQNGVMLPFAADYGWIISPAFGGFQALFGLEPGDAGSLVWAGEGVNATNPGEFPTADTFEAFIPYANLGLTPGDVVDFVLLYGNNNGFDTDGEGDDEGTFLSDESFPFQFTDGNPGFGPVTVTDFHRLVTVVPEPTSLALLGIGGLTLLRRRGR